MPGRWASASTPRPTIGISASAIWLESTVLVALTSWGRMTPLSVITWVSSLTMTERRPSTTMLPLSRTLTTRAGGNPLPPRRAARLLGRLRVGRPRGRGLLDDEDGDEVVHRAGALIGEEARPRRALAVERLPPGPGRQEKQERCCGQPHRPRPHGSLPGASKGVRTRPGPSP